MSCLKWRVICTLQPAISFVCLHHPLTLAASPASVEHKLDCLEFLALRALDTERIRDSMREAIDETAEMQKEWHKEVRRGERVHLCASASACRAA